MDNSTTFYILGGLLAALAVITSFAGLRFRGFPGRYGPLVVLVFVALVGAATTFAVLNGQDEEKARASETEQAGKEVEAAEESASVEAPQEGQGSEEPAQEPQGATKGGEAQGSTLQLAADPTEIAFDKKTLTSKPGKVTIDFTNPSALEHDVAIEKEGKQIVVSDLIAKGKTSVSAELEPGTYTFLCTVPGHAEAGMTGTLTVK
jgi:plastocyanin